MTTGFTLHGSPHSQFTYKVALMLRLSGAGFSFRYVSFQRGQHRTPEFRALSRWGQVPVLEHRGRALVQSGAILEYLAEALSSFGGRDAATRRTIREWLYWDADRLAPPVYRCYGAELARQKLLPRSYDPALAAAYRQEAETALGILDGNLAGREFLATNEPTIADFCCYGDAAFLRLCDIDLSLWPDLAGWAERIAGLPRFQAPFDLLAMNDAEIGP